MTSSRPRPDPGSAAPPDRPPIWINGRQRPSFDLRAYAAYSVIATRAALGPALGRAAGSLGTLGDRVQDGAWPLRTERLGRFADWLPTRPRVARTVAGASAIVGRTSRVVLPPPPEPESLAAYDALWRSRKVPTSGRLRGVDLDEAQADPALRALRDTAPLRPHRVLREVRPTEPVAVQVDARVDAEPASPARPDPDTGLTENDTDLAIRNLMSVASAPPVATPAAATSQSHRPTPGAPQALGKGGARGAWIVEHAARGAAFGLGWCLIALTMPMGMVKAGIAHLDGRDLRDLVEDA